MLACPILTSPHARGIERNRDILLASSTLLHYVWKFSLIKVDKKNVLSNYTRSGEPASLITGSILG